MADSNRGPREPNAMTGPSAVLPSDADQIVIRPRTTEVAGETYDRLDETHVVDNDDNIESAVQAGRAVFVGTPEDEPDAAASESAADEDSPGGEDGGESSGEADSAAESGGSDAENGSAEDDFTDLDGVGPSTADALHDEGYESFDDLRTASTEDLASVSNVSENDAEGIHDQLTDESGG